MVVDLNLRRIVSHKEPERGDKPELSDAQRILAAQAARREALFEESFQDEAPALTPCPSASKKR